MTKNTYFDYIDMREGDTLNYQFNQYREGKMKKWQAQTPMDRSNCKSYKKVTMQLLLYNHTWKNFIKINPRTPE